MSAVRTFDTGATRDLDDTKLDYEGFLNPEVERVFAEYMHRHRQTAAGLRDSDNWQKGIPISAYMKSLFRHFVSVWRAHRRQERLPLEELCAMKFNVNGLILETLKAADIQAKIAEVDIANDVVKTEMARRLAKSWEQLRSAHSKPGSR